MTSALIQLKAHLKDSAAVGKAAALLEWDKEVMMPPDSDAERGQILAALDVVSHAKRTDPRIAGWIKDARGETQDPLELRNLQLLEEEYLIATALPERLVRAITETKNTCVSVWQEAKPKSDWNAVRPSLEALFALVQEKAAILGEALGVTPYDALLRLSARNNNVQLIDGLFNELETALPPMLEQALQRCAAHPPKTIHLPRAVQEQAARQLATTIGFSLTRGRLDVSSHPFSGGTKYDSRITTRFPEGNSFSALMGVLHEVGHAMYSQNTPQEWEDMPLGADSDLSLHESQSLLIEKQVGLSPEFIHYMHQTIQQLDQSALSGITPADMQRHLHHVSRDFIRVEANELTYPLHVVLRYGLEKKLFTGQLRVDDIPQAWNEGMKRLIGVDVPEHRLGCLQDIHWYWGLFGYFPTYTQGALYAAQIFAAAKRALPDLMQQLRRGECATLMGWLHTHIHRAGQIWDIPELITRVTGEAPTAKHFLEHLRARYLANG